MSKYLNLSDGESDGLVLFYLKDKKLNSVVLNKEQAEMLDLSLGVVFKEPLRVIKPNDEVMQEMLKGGK